MDDLRFRKTIYAEPFTKDPTIIKAAAEDPKKQAFWDEMKAMEVELQAAMMVPVPENLAEKLILRQSLNAHSQAKQKRPWYLALAASVVLASVLSLAFIKTNKGSLENQVFAHLGHINLEMAINGHEDTASINDKLASFNGRINDTLGEVISANYCYLDEIKSLHLIIRGEHGLSSLFVMPDSISESIRSTFADTTYLGKSFILKSAKIIVVGESKVDVDNLQQRAKTAFTFSA